MSDTTMSDQAKEGQAAMPSYPDPDIKTWRGQDMAVLTVMVPTPRPQEGRNLTRWHCTMRQTSSWPKHTAWTDST